MLWQRFLVSHSQRTIEQDTISLLRLLRNEAKTWADSATRCKNMCRLMDQTNDTLSINLLTCEVFSDMSTFTSVNDTNAIEQGLDLYALWQLQELFCMF